MLLIKGKHNEDHDRTEAFRSFAQRQANGEVLMSPLMLPEEQRRLYVRNTLREDHQFRIENNPEGAQDKFDKLAGDLFHFFRGTALLFYRDYAGMDAHLPTVFTIGDIHPENFGVMPNEDDAPFFGVNDFDEAAFAPFSYDVKRGALGFYLAAKANGLKKATRHKVVRAWAQGYVNGLMEFAQDDREKWHQFRIDNSPPMIQELLKDSLADRKEFLAEKLDLRTQRFKPSEEIVPATAQVDRFQKIVDRYVKENEIRKKEMADDYFRVLDVATKRGSGTASLGLDRWWVLIQGRSEDAADDIILEMKQARRSALYGLTPEADFDNSAEADQVVEAHHIHLVGGDRFYGRAKIDDHSFLVRERSPYKNDIDTEDLDDDDLCTYADICAKAQAQTHARSDEDTGVMEGDAEKRLLTSIEPDLFVDDVVRFAHSAAKRIKADHKLFKKDHELGAFSFVRDRL